MSCPDLTFLLNESQPQPLTNSPHSPKKKHVTTPCVQRVGGGELCQ